MKKIISIYVIPLLFFIYTGCKKDSSSNSGGKKGPIIYNPIGSNLIKKRYFLNGYYEYYNYNYLNKLEKLSYFSNNDTSNYDFDKYIYDSNGKISKCEHYNHYNNSDNLERYETYELNGFKLTINYYDMMYYYQKFYVSYKEIYTLNSNNLIQKLESYYRQDTLINSWVEDSYFNFYWNNSNISKVEFFSDSSNFMSNKKIHFSKHSSGNKFFAHFFPSNINKNKSFKSSVTLLKAETLYLDSYDMMNNSYWDLNYCYFFEYINSKNNPISLKYHVYDINGAEIAYVNVENQYKYNYKNYPVTITSTYKEYENGNLNDMNITQDSLVYY